MENSTNQNSNREYSYDEVLIGFCDKLKEKMNSSSENVFVISVGSLKSDFSQYLQCELLISGIKKYRRSKLTDDIIEKLKPFTATKFIDWDYKLDENGDKKVKTIYSLKIIKPANSETEQQSSIGETNLDNYSWKDIIVLAEKNKEMLNSVRNDKFEITKIFDTDSNILILFSADWHMGANGTNYNALKNDMEKVIDTENVYIISVGDEIENMNPTFGNKLPPSEQIIPRELENAFFKGLLTELINKNKILAACWGNHDAEFDERTIGYAVKRYLIDGSNIYLPYGGFVNLQLNDINYRFRMTHNYKGSSIYNPNHSNIRSLKEKSIVQIDDNILQGIDADIQAHGHIPAMQYYPFGNKHVILVKTGTYLEYNAFGARYFESVNGLNFPCFILNSKKKQIIPIMGFDIALEIFNAMNYFDLKQNGGKKDE